MQPIDRRYIRKVLIEKCSIVESDKLLVAVSGGADSMALLHLLHSLDYTIAAAHCNFNLRGQESDSDEQLVRSYCTTHAIDLHVKSFETTAYSKEKGISIEMAARDLRYSWFSVLKEQNDFQAIVTGHHGNDSIETFFLNIVRGTGVKGLSGIKFRNGDVVRPLLDFQRSQVEAYCQDNKLAFVHDKSNDDTRFMRNKIRHEVLPVLESINPSFFDTMQANMAHVREAEYMLEAQVERFKAAVLVDEHDKLIIPISKFDEFPQYRTILFEILRPYGFNSSVVSDVIAQLYGRSGKQFFSSSHRLIKDRHNLIVMPKQAIEVKHFWLEEGVINNIEVRIFSKPSDFKFSTDQKCIHLDADLVDLPLLVRKWQQGDVFRPLGMSGFKKVSDYFIDQKYSLADKEEAWLMVSGDDIVGVMGQRLDDRFKVGRRTKQILEIQLP